jgi:hypothetical protein
LPHASRPPRALRIAFRAPRDTVPLARLQMIKLDDTKDYLSKSVSFLAPPRFLHN